VLCLLSADFQRRPLKLFFKIGTSYASKSFTKEESMNEPGKPNDPDKGIEIDTGGLDKEEINLNPDPEKGKEITQPEEPK
jgi:hypothetical protein